MAVILAVLAGCGHSDSKPAKDPPKDPAMTSGLYWTFPIDGIRIALAAPGPTARAGDAIVMALHVENTSDQPRRIYMLGPEAFRATLSDLNVEGSDGRPVGMSQPPPRPHGYLPTEADFPQLAPHAATSFTQTLRLDPSLPPGPIKVWWRYSNHVVKVPGGIQTLDGPTQALFGGNDIPGIWVVDTATFAQLTIVK